ncbi:hypothetical protein FRC19_011673 [Serendipita sp. 401]|nr:hypothetical protein FRC19_011673 [Serendipita sp. 401]KAG9053408.1 hypothetical protein FS842_008248 [Serendipita sp. 407]
MAAANVDGTILNYSRPIVAAVSIPPPRPVRSPDRARTDDECRQPPKQLTRVRARSVPRARAASTPSPPPMVASPTSTMHTARRQRESVLSQQSSLYPPSTVTSASAFSGPETPPESIMGGELPLLDVDDVSYRLKLLVKNNYFLPPPHLKPTQHQVAAIPTTPTKPPALRALFKPSKPPKTQQPVYPPPIVVPKPRNPRPQNRVVVIREQLPDLFPEPLPQSDELVNPVEQFVDPTTAVDVEIPVAPPPPQPLQTQPKAAGDWRTELLHQAVGFSFVTPPTPRKSVSSSPIASYGQPIASLPMVNSQARDMKQTRPLDISNSALRPPPRPPRDRTRNPDDSPPTGDPTSSNPNSHPAPSSYAEGPVSDHPLEDSEHHASRQIPIRPSFAQSSPRPSFSQTMPYSASPFGLAMSPPRHSAATDLTQSTNHYDEHPFAPSRPSMTASSTRSAPRPSISESLVSHYSATFGERSRDSKAGTSTSFEQNSNTSRRSSLAYLRRNSRSRSLSPSRSAIISPVLPPPVPPLPQSSDTEGNSTIIYIHPSGGLSNTVLGRSTPTTIRQPSPIESTHSAPLDPRRGITNYPPAPPSPRFFGLISPKATSGPLPVTVDVEFRSHEHDPVEGTQEGEVRKAENIAAIESWRDAQVHQDEARKFEGMIVQHLESEKDRFRRIAIRGRAE